MSAFDKLMTVIGGEPGLDEAVETLVLGIADRIKATSNDQNVQRLARELRETAPAFAKAVIARASAEPH